MSLQEQEQEHNANPKEKDDDAGAKWFILLSRQLWSIDEKRVPALVRSNDVCIRPDHDVVFRHSLLLFSAERCETVCDYLRFVSL
jgi:hypothetical protein